MCTQKPFAAVLFLSLIFVSTSFAFSPVPTTVSGSELIFAVASNETVSISGQVKTPQGRAIKGAMIVIRDAETNAVVQRATSSGFGYYRLDGIATGHSYVLSVSHKVYLFALPSHLLELKGERSDVNFVGEIID